MSGTVTIDLVDALHDTAQHVNALSDVQLRAMVHQCERFNRAATEELFARERFRRADEGRPPRVPLDFIGRA